MKIIKKIGLAAIAGLVLASCASPVYVQTDESVNLAKYKTYQWVQTRANEQDTKNVTAFADETVQSAVRAELAKEGWTEVTTDPDAFVSYDILVERSVEQQSNPVYTQSFTRTYYNPYRRSWGTIYYPSQFAGYDYYSVPVKEGTLTITLMDADTDKAIWQAWTTEQLDGQKFTRGNVDKSVRNIFKKF